MIPRPPHSDVLYALETFDAQVVRCGVLHFLLCKFIAETSDVKVLLSGTEAHIAWKF
jgi:hypothetical protein